MKNFLEVLSLKYAPLYDEMRIIDTKKRCTYRLNPEGVLEVYPCSHLCKRHKAERPCTCDEVIRQSKRKSEIDFTEGAGYMIVSFPKTYKNTTYVVEMASTLEGSPIYHWQHEEEISQLLNRMNRMTLTDELTGLYNRRYIGQRLPIETDVPLAVIMADIDDFKLVNDLYGHDVGDAVLKQFAQILNATFVNDRGWTARYGGEEFLLVIKDDSIERVETRVEGIKAEIENTPIAVRDKRIQLTCSFGCAYHKGETNVPYQQMVKNADNCLLEAKGMGKNRVILREY